jgi:hypothetical protein
MEVDKTEAGADSDAEVEAELEEDEVDNLGAAAAMSRIRTDEEGGDDADAELLKAV